MSSVLSRSVRRSKAFKERKAEDDRLRNAANVQKVSEEAKAVLDHEYMGIAYSTFAIACRNNHISAERIMKIMRDADRLYGKLHHGEMTICELQDECKEKSSIIVDFDEARHIMLLSHFTQDDRREVFTEISNVMMRD